MGTPDRPDLTRRLECYAPSSVLALGPRAGTWLAGYHKAHPDCRIAYLDPHGTLDAKGLLEALSEQDRFDFAVVRGVLERIDTEDGAHLIARLRDVHTSRFCVILATEPDERRWRAADLIAMGLAHWSSETHDGASVEIFGFDLGTYKATPEWLNARHWAHPEHWDKYRW